MLLNEKEIEQALKRALPKVDQESIQGAVKAIVEAQGQWKEVDVKEDLGAQVSVQCRDICALGAAYEKGLLFRVFIADK
jgi:hypothetical protein